MSKKPWNNLRRPTVEDQANPSAHVRVFGFAVAFLILAYVITSLITGDWNLMHHLGLPQGDA